MTKSKATYTTTSIIELDFDINIFLLNAHIFTSPSQDKASEKSSFEDVETILSVSIETELDSFEALTESAAYARPRLLIILGILSFLTQKSFTLFQFQSRASKIDPIAQGDSTKFNFGSHDYLPQFKGILDFINNSNESDKRLLYSLVDRYRKALFLEDESEESMIHDDEILLSYFHILELLTSAYYREQKKSATDHINKFTESFLKNIYLLEGNKFQSEFSSKKKLVESIFIPELSVGSKIMFMLNQQKILTNRVKAFVFDLIKDRNSVAHGRQVYQDRVIFPIPPFFPLARDRYYSIEMLRVLSGRAISLFLGINHLKEEWAEIDQVLLPTLEELNLFFNEKRHETITIDDFYSGKFYDITPFTITYYTLHKKINAQKTIQLLSSIIINYREIEDEITGIVIAVILIIDSTDNELQEKCREIIKFSARKGWLPDYRMRDILYYLEYLGHEPVILREMIRSKEVR